MNDSITEIQELMDCLKCGQQVEQVLAMQCEHNLCLLCASKTILKQGRQYITCEFCTTTTQLDPSAFQFLQESTSFIPTSPQLFASLQNPLDQQDTKQSVHQNNNTIVNSVCPQHTDEDALLFCLTCECACFCMECYMLGQHKHHEVRNVQKFYQTMKSTKVEQMSNNLKIQQDALFNQQCKITSRKKELLEVLSTVKFQIQIQFEQLYATLKQKEEQLLQSADQVISQNIKSFDQELISIKQQLEQADQYQSQIDNHFPFNTAYCPARIESFNFYSKNHKRIKQFIQNSVTEEFQYTRPKLWFDVSLIQTLIEQIEVVSLQESKQSIPTQQDESKSLCYSVKKNQEKENNYSFLERSSNKKKRCGSEISCEQGEFEKRFRIAKQHIISQKSFL